MTQTPDIGDPSSVIAYQRQLRVPSRVQPGMRLLADVCLSNGAVFVPSGTVLDDTAIQRLIQRQVEFVLVAVPDERSPDLEAEDLQAAALRVEYIFRGESTPVRDCLRRSVMAYRLSCVTQCRLEG